MARTTSAKKSPLTLAQLAAHDDKLTEALVDRVYYWTEIRKNHPYYMSTRSLSESVITPILQKHVVLNNDPKSAMEELEKLPGIKSYMGKLKNADELEHFRQHMEKYVNMWLPDCPFEVTTTNRYTISTLEASVTARKPIRRGETIKYLCGVQVAITDAEEKQLDLTRRNFSIVFSSRKKTQSLFLGPARFANHDCEANAKLSSIVGNRMEVVAKRNIDQNEEITVSYGDDYFGENNCECLCSTCERNGRNGWQSSADGSVLSVDLEPPQRKRKFDDFSESTSRSDTPESNFSTLKRSRKLERSLIRESSNLQSVDEIEAEILIKSEDGDHTSVEQGTPDTPLTKSADKVVNVSSSVQDMAKSTQENDPTIQISEKAEFTAHQVPSFNVSKLAHHLQLNNDASEESDVPPTSDTCIEQSIRTSQSPVSTPASSFVDDCTPGVSSADAAIEADKESTLITNLEDATPKGVLRSDAIQVTATVSTDVSISVVITEKTTTTATLESKLLTEHDSALSDLEDIEVDTVETTFKASITNEKKTSITMTETAKSPTKKRIPGDYLENRGLLAKPYSKRNICETCSESWIQENAYEPRISCPRCERHSKLYGFEWPKTEPEGERDSEVRVMDHREVNRVRSKKRKWEEEFEKQIATGQKKKKGPEQTDSKKYGGLWKDWKPSYMLSGSQKKGQKAPKAQKAKKALSKAKAKAKGKGKVRRK